jgi:hypothetical protein
MLNAFVTVPVLTLVHRGRVTAGGISDRGLLVDGIPDSECAHAVLEAGRMYVISRKATVSAENMLASLDDSIAQYLPEATPFLGLLTKARAWRPEGTKMEWIWKEAPRQIT